MNQPASLVFVAFALLGVACGSSGGESASPDPSGSEGSEGSTSEGTTSEGTTPEGSEGSEGASTNLVISADACTTDADCAPVACCHAAACGAVANAPNCGDAMCTMECRYGTLDCGGSCLCHEGHCAARLSGAPEGVGELPPS